MRNPASASTSKTPCCTKVGLKRGPWTPEEDELLANYVKREGEGRWRTLPKRAGLLRCGKSCRLRWMNYLRPSVKRGQIAPDEEDLILRLHRLLGNRCCLYHFFLVWNLPQILTYWCISLFLKFETFLWFSGGLWLPEGSRGVQTMRSRTTGTPISARNSSAKEWIPEPTSH